MKLISFLGTSSEHTNYRYQQATYRWQGQQIKTEFFPDALLQWVPEIEQVLILLTQEARYQEPTNTNWLSFRDRMQAQGDYQETGPSRVVAVDIPTGRNEQEIWQMFDTLVAKLDPGDEIILDITHAFRSLPVLSLLATIFMRSAGQIQIRHILYGAFEGRDESGVTPVFDLSPFIGLLDWSQAAAQFIETGISKKMGDNLAQIENKLKKQHFNSGGSKSDLANLPKNLANTGKQLQQISDALLLTQPRALSQAVSKLNQQIGKGSAEAEVFVKPFALIQEQLLSAYQAYEAFNLSSMRDLIHWYLEHQHYVQAITLAREWLVCLLCGYLLQEIDPPKSQRKQIESICAAWESQARKEDIGWAQELLDTYQPDQKIACKSDFVNAWTRIASLRNDIAHCYMARHQADGQASLPNSAKMTAKIHDNLNLLNKLPLPGVRDA